MVEDNKGDDIKRKDGVAHFNWKFMLSPGVVSWEGILGNLLFIVIRWKRFTRMISNGTIGLVVN